MYLESSVAYYWTPAVIAAPQSIVPGTLALVLTFFEPTVTATGGPEVLPEGRPYGMRGQRLMAQLLVR